jgi:hypothetical protein
MFSKSIENDTHEQSNSIHQSVVDTGYMHDDVVVDILGKNTTFTDKTYRTSLC